MHNFLLHLVAMQSALNVHQTTRIAHNQCRRLRCLEILDFAFQHFSRKFRMLYGKDSAEATTILGFGQFADFRAFDIRQQFARLAVNAQAAMQVTGWMISQWAVPARAEISDTQNINKIFRELICSRLPALLARGSQIGSSLNNSS